MGQTDGHTDGRIAVLLNAPPRYGGGIITLLASEHRSTDYRIRYGTIRDVVALPNKRF